MPYLVKKIAKAFFKELMDMMHMSVPDIHKRLMLFKMVKEVVALKEKERTNEKLNCGKWLYKLHLQEDKGKQEKLLCL